MKWLIDYENDTGTGTNAEGFEECWIVTEVCCEVARSFKCYNEEDAKWLCDVLNNLPHAEQKS